MRVIIRKEFIDKYTGELHKNGEVIDVTDERIEEIKKVDTNLIEVVEGDTIPTEESEVVEEKVDAPEPPKKSGRKGRKKGEQ